MKVKTAKLIDRKPEQVSSKPQANGLNQLQKQRLSSIDTFRGITILVMIFVNEIAGVRDILQWMRPMPAEADGMTFVDIEFPSILFIIGIKWLDKNIKLYKSSFRELMTFNKK